MIDFKRDSLSDFLGLIRMVDDIAVRARLEAWVSRNVQEFTCYWETSFEELEHVGEKRYEGYAKHAEAKLAHDVGVKMLRDIATREVRETTFGQRTDYRLYGVKRIGG